MKFVGLPFLLSLFLMTGLVWAQDDSWQTLFEKGADAAKLKRYQEAYNYYRKSLEVAEKEGSESPHLVTSLLVLGDLYHVKGTVPVGEAKDYFQRVMTIQESRYGTYSEVLIDPLDNLVEIAMEQKDFTQAETYQKRLVAILEKYRGADDPNTLGELEDLAGIYLHQSRFPEAEGILKYQLSVLTESLPDVSPTSTLYSLSYALEQQGKLQEAVPVVQRLQAAYAAQGDRESQAIIGARLGRIYNLLGQPEKAEPLLLEALTVQKGLDCCVHDYALSLLELGKSYVQLKRYPDAETTLNQALKVYPWNADDSERKERSEVVHALAEVYRQTNREKQAQALEKSVQPAAAK